MRNLIIDTGYCIMNHKVVFFGSYTSNFRYKVKKIFWMQNLMNGNMLVDWLNSRTIKWPQIKTNCIFLYVSNSRAKYLWPLWYLFLGSLLVGHYWGMTECRNITSDNLQNVSDISTKSVLLYGSNWIKFSKRTLKSTKFRFFTPNNENLRPYIIHNETTALRFLNSISYLMSI